MDRSPTFTLEGATTDTAGSGEASVMGTSSGAAEGAGGGALVVPSVAVGVHAIAVASTSTRERRHDGMAMAHENACGTTTERTNTWACSPNGASVAKPSVSTALEAVLAGAAIRLTRPIVWRCRARIDAP